MSTQKERDYQKEVESRRAKPEEIKKWVEAMKKNRKD
jgi:hypothetical protein